MDCHELDESCVLNFDDTYAVCVAIDGMCTVCSDKKTKESKAETVLSFPPIIIK